MTLQGSEKLTIPLLILLLIAFVVFGFYKAIQTDKHNREIRQTFDRSCEDQRGVVAIRNSTNERICVNPDQLIKVEP